MGTNRYAYAGNSPVNQADPSGHLFNDTAFSRGWDSVFGGGSCDNNAIGRANTLGGAADNVRVEYDRAIDTIAERSGLIGVAGTVLDLAAPGYSETRDGLEPAEWETWLSAPWSEARDLQRPLPDGALRIVLRGEKEDTVAPATL